MSLLKEQLTELFVSGYERGAPGDINERMKIIFAYFGFGDEIFATMEDLGKSHGMTKANVSLIKKRLDAESKKEKPELSGLYDLEKIIKNELDKNNGYKLYSDLRPSLVQSGLVDKLNPFGLRNFQMHFNFGSSFFIYNVKMGDASKKNYKNDKEFILARKEVQGLLEIDIKKLLKMPGKGGKAGIVYLDSYVCQQENFTFKLDELKKILLASDIWSKEDENKRFWFLVESRGNPIITVLGKIKKVSKNRVLEKYLIINAVSLYLSRRSSEEEREAIFPPQNIIQSYITESKFVDSKTYSNKYILSDDLNTRNIRWTSIDQGIADYFKTREFGTLGELEQHFKLLKVNKDLGALPYHPLLVEILGGTGKKRKFAFVATIDSKNLNLATSVEDAALGGSEGEKALWESRHSPSPEEFEESQKRVKEIGKYGEELVNAYLNQQEYIVIHWDSNNKNQFAPYDFRVERDDGSNLYIDVKSTEYGFTNKIHISYRELLEMRKQANYQIYRVYEISDTRACLKKSQNLQSFSKKIIDVLARLPEQVFPKGISFSPTILTFGAEILLPKMAHSLFFTQIGD